MNIDMSKIKVGDTIRFRDEPDAIVTKIEEQMCSSFPYVLDTEVRHESYTKQGRVWTTNDNARDIVDHLPKEKEVFSNENVAVGDIIESDLMTLGSSNTFTVVRVISNYVYATRINHEDTEYEWCISKDQYKIIKKGVDISSEPAIIETVDHSTDAMRYGMMAHRRRALLDSITIPSGILTENINETEHKNKIQLSLEGIRYDN